MGGYPRYRLIIDAGRRSLKLYREFDRVRVELVAEAKLGEEAELSKLAGIVAVVNEELARK